MKEKKFNFVYLTTNLVNGKQYVGDHSTNNLEKDNYIGSGIYFLSALNEYEKQNFKREIIEFFPTKQEAFNIQEKYIIMYDTLVPNGYNISPKGGHNVKGCISKETSKKISKANKGRKLEPFSKEHRRKLSENNGSHRPEVREKIRKSNKGRQFSEKHKQKLRGPKSEEHKQKLRKPKSRKPTLEMNERNRQTHLGKHHTEQTKQNMRHPHKPLSEETKKNMSISAKQVKKMCPYCNILCCSVTYNRWHGEKCKYKK